MPGEVTIDFGIDLGTTNSAMAVFLNEMSQIIKCTATGSDVTPSVVSHTSSGDLVGMAAKNRVLDNPDSTFKEFKRSMGTTTTYPLVTGGRITPEELSAEVLRSLRHDAFDFSGTDVTAAVITVPAAFDTAQIAATRVAGEMAGFSHVETLQEPIAAALAYGLDQAGEGLFLVFDLGGGTFDAALLKCTGGVFSVVNHRGDNDLGGAKWDGAIVDEIILPKLKAMGAELAAASHRRSKTFQVLKESAEEARIELSRRESVTFNLDRATDDAGNHLPDDITMTLAEFEPLIEPTLERGVRFCRELLGEASIPTSAVSKVILVGGPTRTPAVRRAVQELGVELATMVDPMTVVARGAAVYAASRTRPVAVSAAPQESAVFQLLYDAMVERDKDEVMVGLKLERAAPGVTIASVRIMAADGSWDSGQVRLEDGTAIVNAKLIAPGTATFRVTASSAEGSPILVSPEAFTVTRAVAAAAAPVNHSIGVGVDDASGRKFSKIVQRGATMPVVERKRYWTTRAVSPGEPDQYPIQLLFLEGESQVPERNVKVGEILIWSDDITRPLPANSEVEITIRWEQGQDPKASAYIAFLDKQFDRVLRMQNKQLPDIAALREEVAEIRRSIDDRLGTSDDRARRLHEIEVRLIDAERGDAPAAHSAAEQIGPLLDAIEADSAEELLDTAIAQLAEAESWARDIVSRYGNDEDQEALERLMAEARGAAAGGDHRDVDYRKDRIVSLAWQVMFRQPGFWIDQFAELASNAADSTDPLRAGELVQRGRAALDRQDIDQLREVVRGLWTISPELSGGAADFGIRHFG